MQYKRRGGWNKQAAGLTNQANFSSGKSPVLLFLELDFELKMSASSPVKNLLVPFDPYFSQQLQSEF